MLQILQNLKTGATELVELPALTVQWKHLLIRTRATLVSQGTEKMLVQFGKASLFQKARSQPDKVRQVLQKIRSDGLVPSIEAVFRRLDEPLPLGYCNAGVVIGVGEGVVGYSVGDRVVSNGPHAEIVSVPANLVAKVPDNVSDDAAPFTVVGAIGLQGIRLVAPELGETFVVIGLGLIGQLTAQLLRAAGCRVVGFDFDRSKVELARTFGIDAVVSGGESNSVQHVTGVTGGLGADGVIITASTSSNDVVTQAAQMSRKRGRIVLIGVVGLNLNRADFYEKELSFQVSCSYGPGRYDDTYEEKGYDYPPAFVRWTENRNFQAVLHAMQSGALNVLPLITRRVPLANYYEIYDDMSGGGLASLLIYGGADAEDLKAENGKLKADGARERGEGRTVGAARSEAEGALSGGPLGGERHKTETGTTIRLSDRKFLPTEGILAVIGAGNFAKMTAMPALAAAKAPVKTIVSSGGVTGTSLAKKYGVPLSSTDYRSVLEDPEVKGVIITTRHNLHAGQIIDAVKAGKHVLVEKPLCLNLDELGQIEAVLRSSLSVVGGATENREQTTNNSVIPTVTVGFNRRFSPHTLKMRALLGAEPGPMSIVATMNAGAIPQNHWVHDPAVGGGRLVGEACHFIDLAIFLTGSLVVEVGAAALTGSTDCASVLLRHANGSTSVVNYFAHGHRELSKERVEVHAQGRSLLLDNFRELRGFGFRSFAKLKTKQDKGHARQFALFAEWVKTGGPALIPWSEIANGTRATLAIARAVAERRWIPISEL